MLGVGRGSVSAGGWSSAGVRIFHLKGKAMGNHAEVEGRCIEPVGSDEVLCRLETCGEHASGVKLMSAASGTPLADLERPPVVAGPYCEAHGGKARAQSEAVEDWYHAAPDSVGDADAVLDAGTRVPCSEHRIIVLRGPDDRGRWQAWRGLGTHARTIYPRGVEAERREILLRYNGRRKNARRRAQAAHSALFDDADEALRRALEVLRGECEAEVERIRKLRGGTLSWGMPVSVERSPAIKILPVSGGDAWKAKDLCYAEARALLK